MTLPQHTTSCMPMIRALSVVCLALPALASAQVQAISTSASYVFGLTKQSNVGQAEAFGGGAELRLTLSGEFALSLSGAYNRYSIEQPDALNQWDWKFWNDRYYPKIQSDMRADPNLTSQIGYVQSMQAIPVILSLIYRFSASEELVVSPRVGGGVSFFARRLYADETWTKQFPSADYTLTYNLRNFAPEKEGNVFLGAVGVDVEYGLASDLTLVAGVEYRRYLSSSSGYDQLPFADEAGCRLGLSFLY